jgi:hypothetical protein
MMNRPVYQTRRPPYAHQKTALEKSRGAEYFAYIMAMRTGKTKTCLDDFGDLWSRGLVDDLLVIAPAGVYETWLEAIQEHWDPALHERALVLLWRARDGGKEAKARLSRFLSLDGPGDPPRVLLINVEALSSVERAREVATSFVKGRRTYAAVDESTSIGNPKSKRAKFVIEEIGARAKYRRILCGLVAPRGPLPVFAQFQFLEPGCLGFDSYAGFRSFYAITRRGYTPVEGKDGKVFEKPFEMVVAYRNEEDLRERIKPHSFRVRLEDCHDVPPVVYMKRHVEMTEEQARIYRELKTYSTSQLSAEAHVTATMVIVKMLRLHQVLCGLSTDEEGRRHEFSENKSAEVLSALAEYEGKAIIWCAYDASLRRVVSMLEREYGQGSVARFWGGNRDTREEEERRFKTDPGCRFMVATAGAGGRGRTWDVADLTIYHSCTNNLEHREQSEERMKNVGKTRPMTVVDLITPGTVETKILAALREKIDLAATIQGDAWREWVV